MPGVAQTVTLTRIATLSTPMPPGEDLTALARSGATLVLHLAAAQIDAIVPQLLAGGYRPETPAAVVAYASWPQQTVLRGTLADIAEQMHDAAITKTAVIVVGDVLAAEGFTDSYLYSAAAQPGAAGTDAGAAARRHRRGAGAGRTAAPAGRRRQLAGRTRAGPGAAGGRGANRRIRRRRRAANAGCTTNISTPSSTPPTRSRPPSPRTPPKRAAQLRLPLSAVGPPGLGSR